MVSIEGYGSERERRGRAVETASRLSPMEREVLLDIVMATAGFVLIIAAILLGLSV